MFVGCILLQSIIYGFGNAFTKVAFESISPFWCLTVRFGLASLLFVILFGKGVLAQLRGTKAAQWLPAGLFMAAAYIFCNMALDKTSATNVGFLTALPVVFAPFLAAVVFSRRYRFIHLPVQLAVIGGLYLLCCNGGSFSFGAGEALAILTSLCNAGALVFGEKAMRHLDVAALSTVQVSLTFFLSLAGALTLEGDFSFQQVTGSGWVVVGYLTIFCTCIAFALQNLALTHISSNTVSMLICSQPVCTAAVAAVVLGEGLNGIGLVGAAVIVVCILAENAIDIWLTSRARAQEAVKEMIEEAEDETDAFV